MKTEELEPEPDYAFSHLQEDIEETEPQGGPEPDLDEVNLSALQKRLNDKDTHIKRLQEQINSQNKKIEDISPHLDKVTRLGEVFNPKEPTEEELRQKELEEFDVNPMGQVKNIISNELKGIKDSLTLEQRRRTMKTAMHTIDQKYDVEWDKNAPKIKAYMDTFDKSFVETKPTEALFRASKLAGVLKPKEEFPDFLSPHATPQQIRKHEANIKDKYKQSFINGKKMSGSEGIDSFFGI